jgi:hypothetical protein
MDSSRGLEDTVSRLGNNHFIIKHEGIAVDNTAVMSTPAEKVAALTSVTSRSLTVSGRLCKILVDVPCIQSTMSCSREVRGSASYLPSAYFA